MSNISDDLTKPEPQSKIASASISAPYAVGILISAIWVMMVLVYFTFSGAAILSAFQTPLVGIVTIVAVILPIVLVWTAVMTAGTARKLRAEAQELRSNMNDVSLGLQAAVEHMPKETQEISKQLKHIAEMILKNEKRLQAIETKSTSEKLDVLDLSQTVFGNFQSSEDETQISLPLIAHDDGANLPPLPIEDFIRTLNFPNSGQDKEGFRALRRAMQDRKLRKMLDAARNVMTALTEEGIYMDDLTPDRPVPSAWREFAHGVRGKAVTTVGGVRDKVVLAMARARMKNDPDFQETAHEFMQQFDRVLCEYEPQLKNHEITDLANTRSAKTFMLLARISGAFD